MRKALFITCFNDMMFPRTGQAVTEVLERLGHTVEFPRGQTCCGQMHFNTGYRPETLPMVRRFAEVFADYGWRSPPNSTTGRTCGRRRQPSSAAPCVTSTAISCGWRRR
ncbi:heterodisulfide reductase-related iron-sulfur binding cluster [Streptomyces sp. MB09-02B]|uniref:heterodisulfide reductase-related iron-sulfur binding cluster n=1 Tax=Streptomyces sp. MB09-02B TaxID=3028667 RepID=UPI0039AF24A2